MVAGHLREKSGYYYAVLNYTDALGKRKTKWIKTGLAVKGNKKKAEASCASLLLANGVPMKQIQEWLGHSDFSTTANIYAHLEYSSKLSSADAMLSGLGVDSDAKRKKPAMCSHY